MSLNSRRLLAAILLVAVVAVGAAAMLPVAADPSPIGEGAWVKPPGLKPGDTVAFVAPAGPADPEKVRAAKVRFEAQGLRVSVPANLFRKDRYLAGSDDERAAEFNAALRDKSVRAVVAVRGGYGLTRVLDRVDYAALKADPKIIAGFSDVTALHLAVARKCRLVTFHSPMPQASLWTDKNAGARFSAEVFWRQVRADQYPKGESEYALPHPADQPRPKCLVAGKAQGRLVGGNLSLIAATVGTPFQVEAEGNILVLEDTGEAAYRIDRFLSQLKLAGLLDKFAGVATGTFDGTDPKELEALFREYFGGLKVPVITGYPVGHGAYNTTFPHGGRAELDAGAGTIRLLESPIALR